MTCCRLVSLQTSDLSKAALLVVGDQINSKRGDELIVCTLKIHQLVASSGTETALSDLDANFTGWIPVHEIAEAVEPVLQQRLIGRNAFVQVKGHFNMQQ